MKYWNFYILPLSIILLSNSICHSQEYSLQFLASGSSNNPDIDRVVIPLGNPGKPVNVAIDFTIEFWMKAKSGDNNANGCNPNEWYFGNVIIDRDVFGDGDYGDYGIVLCNRRIVVGVQRSNLGHGGVVGNTIVDDGVWHHIAVTRQASSGGVWLYIDGILDASSSSSLSTGDISYRVGRSTMYPDDPTLVFGAEKHDYQGSLYYKGKLDEFRLSNIIRYTSNFTPPIQAFITDVNTVALYHFNDGSGTILTDVSDASGGPSHGTIQYGGNPAGPAWSYDSPFHPALEVTNISDTGPGTLRQIISEAPSGSLIVFSPSLQNLTISLNSPITINKALIIEDLNTSSIRVHANGTGPVFLVEAAASSVVLSSFRIRSGQGTNGRCIYNQGTLKLENMLIEDLTPGTGSCILNTGNLDIAGSVVVD
jgi:hypothetical protein